MRANEIIRNLLDLIDQIDHTSTTAEPECTDDPNRQLQIADILNAPASDSEFANEPDEIYLGIQSVTTRAGGGVNGPKHPHDLRIKDPSMYPNQQRA